jgi:hypothetical protein
MHKMHSHLSDRFLDVYVAAVIVTAVIWRWILRPALARRQHRSVAALLDLFDPGTAEMSGDDSVRGWYNRPSAFGLYQGRPAAILTRPGLAGNIRFLVSGHFYLPFEVRAKTSLGLLAIRQIHNFSRFPMWFLLLWFLDFHRFIAPGISLWKLLIALIVLYSVLMLAIRSYARWAGYADNPDEVKWQVPCPGSPPLLYKTYSPSRVRPVIDSPEMQDSIGRLMGNRQVNLLRSPGEISIYRKLRKRDDSTLEAHCTYRGRLLAPDVVRDTLADLSTLCSIIERVIPPDELVNPAAPRQR